MTAFWVIITIYGLGVMFSFCLFLYALVGVIADSSFKDMLRLLKKFPLGVSVASCYSIIWPVMLYKDNEFREIVIGCGRLAIPFGYLMSAIMMFQYPMIWVWFMAFFASWILLNHYHQRKLVQSRE